MIGVSVERYETVAGDLIEYLPRFQGLMKIPSTLSSPAHKAVWVG